MHDQRTMTYSINQQEVDGLAPMGESQEPPEAIIATAKRVGATHLERTAVGRFLVRYNEANTMWELLPIRPDGSLYHEDWIADSNLTREMSAGGLDNDIFCLHRGDSLATQQQVVGIALAEYNRRIGHRESGVITHFQWIDDQTFWVYKLRQSGGVGQYDRHLERRKITIQGGSWKNPGWELVEVSSLDLATLLPVGAIDSRLTIGRWPAALVYGLLDELAGERRLPVEQVAEELRAKNMIDPESPAVDALCEFAARPRSMGSTPLLDNHPDLRRSEKAQVSLIRIAIAILGYGLTF